MTKSLGFVVTSLEKKYGQPANLKTHDPFELILLENIAYLASDDRRFKAFETLKEKIGVKPTDLLSANIEDLVEITRIGGIHPELRAHRLQEIARIALTDFEGDLNLVLDLPIAKAVNALKKFPSIGEPGAKKILLFARGYPLIALDSNGLRVLLRLGFGREHKNYATAYRSVEAELVNQGVRDAALLVRAYQLLRQHGQELCKTNNPLCHSCPLSSACRYYAEHSAKM